MRDELINSAQQHPNTAEKAYQKILRMATASEQSSCSVRRKLAKAGYSEAVIEEALERAVRNRVIDDARYAEFYARSRFVQGKGLYGIRRDLEELCTTDAMRDLIESELLFDDSTEYERALDYLYRKPPRAKNKRDAAYRKLVQQGFSSAIASSAARVWSCDADALDAC